MFLQLLGYYIKFASDKQKPPLCFLLTEDGVRVLFFPYNQVQHVLEKKIVSIPANCCTPVVDCIVSPLTPLFLGRGKTVNQFLLGILLPLSSDVVSEHVVKVINIDTGTRKAQVANHTETMREALRKAHKRAEAAEEALREANKRAEEALREAQKRAEEALREAKKRAEEALREAQQRAEQRIKDLMAEVVEAKRTK